jgi:GH15 family glucan-1,4-alpha-glucosidase
MIDTKKALKVYNESIKVLKEVQLKNGGCLATPKGKRYPYVYPRDHSLIILGFLSAGLYENAKKGLEFIFATQTELGNFPQRVDMEGHDASYKPVQIDGTGLVLYALYEYFNKTSDKDFVKDHFDFVKNAVKYIIVNSYDNINGDYERIKHHPKTPLIYTPNSVHEYPPTEAGLEIWANSVCCAALSRSYELSKFLGKEQRGWRQEATKVKNGILHYMWNIRKKTFVKTIRIREANSVLVDSDISKYAIADFGILKDNDKKVVTTVIDIESNLWNRDLGGICRYPKYEGRNNGGWGPWFNYTLMLARHFIRTNNKKNLKNMFLIFQKLDY